ncbi:MAG: anti sigma factor C-terminal domain-containing protein [Bacillota bacterium]|nr:anti sigma factor C-terminal domain-containing protein [Bacillota bacterium]
MKKNNYNNDKANDEKELDKLFDNIKDTRLKQAIKKAQWHSIIRNVLISFLVFSVFLIGGSILNSGLVYKLEGPVQIAVDAFNEISAPNRYIGKVSRYHEVLGGRNEYTTYKIIEGKVVYTGEGEYNYGLFRDYQGNWIGSGSPLILSPSWDEGDLELQRYNELGQREMVFFYPFLDYTNYKSDLQLLDHISRDKVMEMALSFDQAYSLDEVNNILPDNVTLAWYWIDDLNEQEKLATKPRSEVQQHHDGTTYEVDYPPMIRSEETVYGIKAYNHNGDPHKEPVKDFITALKNGTKFDTRFKSEFERVYNNLASEDGEINAEDIKVLGVVVTGDVDSFKSLSNLAFIKAASLGVVTYKY